MTDRPPKFALLRRAPRLEIGRVADLWDFRVDAERDFATAQLRLRLRLRLATRGRRAAAICRQRPAAAAAAGRRVAFWALRRDFWSWQPSPGVVGAALRLGRSWTDARRLVLSGRAYGSTQAKNYALDAGRRVRYRYVTLYLGGRVRSLVVLERVRGTASRASRRIQYYSRCVASGFPATSGNSAPAGIVRSIGCACG